MYAVPAAERSVSPGGPRRIAAYGNGVRHTVKGGTGSGEVNSRYSVNVEQGLKDAGFTITTAAGWTPSTRWSRMPRRHL